MSLVQVALKLTSPGVPDFYQGTELWDFSLVDPDNRRPVDYEARRNFAGALDQTPVPELAASWKDGRIKMRLIRALLRHRREQPEVFSQGSYLPLRVSGPHAERFVSFLRQDGERQLLVVALRRMEEDGVTDLKEICEGAILSVPKPPKIWRGLLDGRKANSGEGEIPLHDLLDTLPVAIFAA